MGLASVWLRWCEKLCVRVTKSIFVGTKSGQKLPILAQKCIFEVSNYPIVTKSTYIGPKSAYFRFQNTQEWPVVPILTQKMHILGLKVLKSNQKYLYWPKKCTFEVLKYQRVTKSTYIGPKRALLICERYPRVTKSTYIDTKNAYYVSKSIQKWPKVHILAEKVLILRLKVPKSLRKCQLVSLFDLFFCFF